MKRVFWVTTFVTVLLFYAIQAFAITEYVADIPVEVGVEITRNNETCTTFSSQETCDLLNSTAELQNDTMLFDNTTSCGLIPSVYNCSYDYGNVIITIGSNNNTYSQSSDLKTSITTMVSYTFNQTVAIDYASVQSIIQGQNREQSTELENFIREQNQQYVDACRTELPVCQTQFQYCNSSLGSCEVVRDERGRSLDDYKTVLTVMTIISLFSLGGFAWQFIMNRKGGPGGIRKSFSDTFRSQ